jgi:hypothetical protein
MSNLDSIAKVHAERARQATVGSSIPQLSVSTEPTSAAGKPSRSGWQMAAAAFVIVLAIMVPALLLLSWLPEPAITDPPPPVPETVPSAPSPTAIPETVPSSAPSPTVLPETVPSTAEMGTYCYVRCSAALLDDGRVLVIGSNQGFSTGEIFDPASDSFSLVGQVPGDFSEGGSAVALDDGRVLLVFGLSDRAELYDPTTGEITPTDVTYQQGVEGAAAQLDDGRVLLVESNSTVGRIFDPHDGTLTPTSPMAFMEGIPDAVLLDSGEVLLVGMNRALTYDPLDDAFEEVGNPVEGRDGYTIDKLADGRVIFIGGLSRDEPYDLIPRAVIYDPTTRTSTAAGALNIPRFGHDAVLLADGRVVVLGGSTEGLINPLDQVEVYDPATDRFTLLERHLVYPRLWLTSVALNDGRILIFGHYPGNFPSDTDYEASHIAELYQP